MDILEDKMTQTRGENIKEHAALNGGLTMKFTVAGNKIICSRIDNTMEGADRYQRVVEFDAHLDTVPHHAAARMTRREVEELEHFLMDRKRIQENSAEVNMLEALPELVEEAIDILDSVSQLNETMYRKLNSSITRMAEALDNVKPKRKGRVTPIHGMRKSEALKERLANIKQEL